MAYHMYLLLKYLSVLGRMCGTRDFGSNRSIYSVALRVPLSVPGITAAEIGHGAPKKPQNREISKGDTSG